MSITSLCRKLSELLSFNVKVLIPDMIYIVTDFGWQGPYIGQMKAVLATLTPSHLSIDLMHDMPSYQVKHAAYLLPALVRDIPEKGVFLCVVDPGVGSDRGAIALEVDGNWFVGPDNGLFDRVAAKGGEVKWFHIEWCPDFLSSSFHGRDLFAPIAAAIANGQQMHYLKLLPSRPLRYIDNQLLAIIYFDGYGNAVTGVEASYIAREREILVRGRRLRYANTFSSVSKGGAFWYENSMGLIEFAVNQGSARDLLALQLGDEFAVV